MTTAASKTLEPSPRVLLGPGPSNVPPRVLSALGMPPIGHLDPEFIALMDEMQGMLRQVFRTENPLTLAVSGTGSAGMEAVIVNLVEPGDNVLVCVNGVFGGRMVDVAGRAGAQVARIDRPWGEVFDPQEVEEAIKRERPKLVGIVHAETSSGALQPVEEIARIAHGNGAMIAIDTVTSLAGVPVEIDAWDIDAVYSGTQKCLSCPPGLAPVSFGPRAIEAIKARTTKIQSWYLDMTMIGRYWGSDRFYHHTAPINMNFALRGALAIVLDEGLEPRFARHRLNAQALASGLKAMGIDYVPAEGHRLPQLNCVTIPEGVDDLTVRKRLLNEWNLEIGGGLGNSQGQGLADWPDGLWIEAGVGHPGAGGVGDLPARLRSLRRARCGTGRRCGSLQWSLSRHRFRLTGAERASVPSDRIVENTPRRGRSSDEPRRLGIFPKSVLNLHPFEPPSCGSWVLMRWRRAKTPFPAQTDIRATSRLTGVVDSTLSIPESGKSKVPIT